MKSKDCLNLLMFSQTKVKNEYEFVNSKTKERLSIDDCYEIIIKDLEVLEILKRKSVVIHLVKDIMKDDRKFECYPDENLTQEEFDKIKEWLENDN